MQRKEYWPFWFSTSCSCNDRSSASARRADGYSKLAASEMTIPDPVNLPARRAPDFLAQFPKAAYHPSVAIRILPLSCVFVGMITFNDLCLKHVEVSFYSVARSLTIVFNVFFSWVLLGQASSKRTVACLFVVVFGFALGTEGEFNFSLLGTACGVLSSLFVSLNSIFTKKVLPAVDDNHWKLTWYNNVNASLLFLPLVYHFEKDMVLGYTHQLHSTEFWIAMSVAGFFGFAIGIVTVLQIKATSPLSHNISGTAKAAFQSIMAFYIWSNSPTVSRVIGIFTVLGGSLLYTMVKMAENVPSRVSSGAQGANSDARVEISRNGTKEPV
jgi:GDP-fucose transporter C1